MTRPMRIYVLDWKKCRCHDRLSALQPQPSILIILFGRNVASYKFALAEALLQARVDGSDFIRMDELAVPFSAALCRHLRDEPKQNTQSRSAFLTGCQQYNAGEMTADDLRALTVKRGFDNVIDAFHMVHGNELNTRFFIDERRQAKGIRLTDDFLRLRTQFQADNLAAETEARWRLVETAWRLNISNRLIDIEMSEDYNATLYARDERRRVSVTSAKPALNGYQKGKCFYCFREVNIHSSGSDGVDVDHFLPHVLGQTGDVQNVNGVWNLVLACRDCNRGVGGKMAQIPSLNLLKRLHRRNEYYVSSHHPLRDTIIEQTGKTESVRQRFLNNAYNNALYDTKVWEPEPRAEAAFLMTRSDDVIPLQWYAQHASTYAEQTWDRSMASQRQRLSALLKPGARILDAGCGSGRDTHAFIQEGYQVEACDGCRELVSEATRRTQLVVRHVDLRAIAEVYQVSSFDGIWCSAVLHHFPHDELPDIIAALSKLLKTDGILQFSVKEGDGLRQEGERYFYCWRQDDLLDVIAKSDHLKAHESWIDHDATRDLTWLHVQARRVG